MEKFLFLVLMLISRLFHAGSHTIILMLMLMLVLIAQVGTRLKLMNEETIAPWVPRDLNNGQQCPFQCSSTGPWHGQLGCTLKKVYLVHTICCKSCRHKFCKSVLPPDLYLCTIQGVLFAQGL